MKAVRVNGQITEVKQLKTKANFKMGDHLGSIHFLFFQFGYDWQKYQATLPFFSAQIGFIQRSKISTPYF